MKNFLRRPAVAIGAVLAVQSAVLALGWFAVYNATFERIAVGVSEIIIENNRLVAQSLSDTIGTLPNDFDPEDPAWSRAQQAVSGIDFGAGGFACILDEHGEVVCHPDIENPLVRGMKLGDEKIASIDQADDERIIRELGASGVEAGIVDLGADGLHYIATKVVSEDGSRLLVHQPVSGLSSAVDSVTGGLLARMVVTGLLIISVSGFAIGWLMQRNTRDMVAWNRDLECKVRERTEDVRRSREAIVLALAKITEYRDNETGMHVERIGEYSRVVGEELRRRRSGLDAQWIEQLHIASTLHDIGKVAVPDGVLKKPGKLTDDEFRQIKRHPSVGADTLIAVHRELKHDPMVAMAVEICLYHHERWDGGGYPVGLSGEDIPLSARIVAVVDVFDALLSPRVYKPAMPREKVIRIIRESAGSHFDPEVVDAFVACLPELFRIREEREDAPPASAAA
ncbi:MAG: HD domain-containing phosphohydrolase [Planctomycetota bacterium]